MISRGEREGDYVVAYTYLRERSVTAASRLRVLMAFDARFNCREKWEKAAEGNKEPLARSLRLNQSRSLPCLLGRLNN